MKNKLVVITGASSGIGMETARKLSAEGYSLLLLARRIEILESMKLPNTLCKKVDVTDAETFKNAIVEAESLYGKVDCIINNAGVMLLGDASNQSPAEWKHMFDVNVLGLLNGISAVLSDMKERKTGTIINISSIAGRKTFPGHSVYCGTKFAVHAMTENIREEVSSSDVRCITIAPGAVETELLSHTTSDAIKESYTEWKESMGGVLNPKDIAGAISYAYNQPQNVCVREVVIAATRQEP